MSEADKRPPHLIFSDEERRQIVRNFVEAYLANEIQLVWPTKEEYEQLAKYHGYLQENSLRSVWTQRIKQVR